MSASFEEADLRETALSQADLDGVCFTRAKLGKAHLNGAIVTNATAFDASFAESNLCGANLSWSIFDGANFGKAQLLGANLSQCSFKRADLSEAHIGSAELTSADFTGARLKAARLRLSNLSGATFALADLKLADLSHTRLFETSFAGADLSGSRVFGASVWDVDLSGAKQSDLVITEATNSPITVDNLDVAQFIYLLLNNDSLRSVIDAITSKVVLILGRFTAERKPILDALRSELRKRNYLPILFDFSSPGSRDITETISTLAHMARFVVADITDAKSIPQELMRIVPALPSVPVQPLLAAGQAEYGMFEHFRRFPWVLEAYLYDDQESLLKSIEEHVIAPAEQKVREQAHRGG